MKDSYIKVKKPGYIFMFVSVFLGIAAVNTGNNLLYMIVSFMLSFMLVSGFMARYNLRGLKIKLIPPPDVYAGKPARFRLIAENKKRIPSFLVRVMIEEAGGKALFLYIKERRETEISLKFPGRGYIEKINVLLVSDFPVGMFDRGRREEAEINVTVFPEPVRAEMYVSSESEEESSESGRTEGAGYEDLRDLKPYAGEPAKYIHWKASAKRDELIVREMEGEGGKPVIIDMEKMGGDLEERISKCAYLVEHLMRAGNPVGFKYKDIYIEPDIGDGHRRKILSRLALM